MMSHVCINYQFGCGILKMVGPKKIRFLAKNQHSPKEKSLKYSYEECQFIKLLGIILESKVVQKLSLEKKCF